MGRQEWPDGCITFAVNLVRPVQQGHRKKILYRIMGSGLVFESLQIQGTGYTGVHCRPGLFHFSEQENTDAFLVPTSA